MMRYTAVVCPRRTHLATVALVTILAAFATPAAPSWAAGPTKKPARVPTDLREFDITLKPASLKAGKVTFALRNTGGVDHEFVVVRLPQAGAKLATTADGALDETRIPAADQVGEVATLAPKRSKALTVSLPPGAYQLFCNLVDRQPDGRAVSHYALGMHTNLTAR